MRIQAGHISSVIVCHHGHDPAPNPRRQVSPFAGILYCNGRKTGELRAVAGTVDKLADWSAVEADGDDGCKLPVTAKPTGGNSVRTMKAAQTALRDEVGPDAKVPPVHLLPQGTLNPGADRTMQSGRV